MLLDIGTTQPILHIFASSFAKSSGKKNTSLLWQGNRHYTAHTLASQTKLFIPQEPNVESCVSCGCLKIRKNPPKCLLIDSRNPMFFFFFLGPYRNKTIMRIPVSQSHGSWSPSSGPAAPVDIPAPWGQTAEVFVAKNVGVGKISGYHRSPVTRLPRPNSWESFVWRAQTNPKFANNEPRTPKVLEQHLRRRKNDCTTHLWIQNSC